MAKKTIGRYDRADFPELELKGLKVKVDTGAYTSSLDACRIHERRYKGVKHLYFKTLNPDHPKYSGKTLRFSEYGMKVIRSSNGVQEVRYYVDTTIRLFGKNYPITVTLADRSKMRTEVLLGRKLIKNRFVVDVTRSDLSLKKKKKRTAAKASIKRNSDA